MRPARTLAVAACLVAAMVVLAGCGTPRVDPSTAEPPQEITMMPSNNAFVTSIQATEVLSSANVDIDLTTTIGDQTQARTAEGVAALRRGFGELTWTEDGSTRRERYNGKGVFLQDDIPDGMWTHLPKDELTPTIRLADPLRGLGQLQDITSREDVTTTGVPVTRYAGRLAADPERLAYLALTPEQIAGIGEAWQGQSIDVVAWTDPRRRVVRVDRSFEVTGDDGVPVSVTVKTVLDDFGAQIDLAPPKPESVIEASDSASASTASSSAS